MATKPDTGNGFAQLFADVKDYVKLQGDYLRIEFVEKLTKLIATLLLVIIALVLVLGILFYLLFSIAYALAPSLGMIASLGLIAGVYFILLLVVIFFRKQLILNPLLRIIVDLFYEDPQNEKDGKDETNNE